MNYFAHGYRFLDDPYFLAGTAVPDWLCVVDRRVRVRSRAAEPFTAAADVRIAALARGIVQHHRDDAWFHERPAFVELSLSLTRLMRTVLPPEDRHRPAFLGHILVEILLDAELIADDPCRLDAYYAAVQRIESPLVAQAVGQMAGREAGDLAWFIGRFCAERFLSDYAENAKLARRLSQVMRRVGLAPLPPELEGVLSEARRQVRERRGELLTE